MHKHRCSRCHQVWEHDEDDLTQDKVTQEQHELAHTCPTCFVPEWWHYLGQAPVTCTTPERWPEDHEPYVPSPAPEPRYNQAAEFLAALLGF